MANYADIQAACEQLKSAGQVITLDAVIKKVGGSPTSIMVNFDRWCADHNYQPPAVQPEAKSSKSGLGLGALSALTDKVPGSFSKALDFSKKVVKQADLSAIKNLLPDSKTEAQPEQPVAKAAEPVAAPAAKKATAAAPAAKPAPVVEKAPEPVVEVVPVVEAAPVVEATPEPVVEVTQPEPVAEMVVEVAPVVEAPAPVVEAPVAAEVVEKTKVIEAVKTAL